MGTPAGLGTLRRTNAWALLALSAALNACGAQAPSEPELETGQVAQALPSGSSGNAIHLNLSGLLAADSMVISDLFHDKNLGGNPTTTVALVSADGHLVEYRPLLWFDTWMLPRPVSSTQGRIDVTSAALSLELKAAISGTSPTPVTLATLGLPWVEGTQTGQTCTLGATWDKPNCAAATTWTGGLTNATTVTSFSIAGPTGVKAITIPSATIEAYNRSEDFKGWVLRPTSSTYRGSAQFTTREGWLTGQGTVPPQLDLDYACLSGYQNDLTFGPGGCTGDAGQACREAGQCASGVCKSGVCLGDNEKACSSNTQCISGSCVSGKCAGFRAASIGATRDTYIQSAAEVNRGAAHELLNGRMQEGSNVNVYRPLVNVPFPVSVPRPVVVNGITTERIVIDDIKLKLNQVIASADTGTITANLRRVTTAWSQGTDTTQTTCTGGATNNKPNCTSSTVWPSNAFSSPVTSVGLDAFRGQKVWMIPATELPEFRKTTHQGFLIELASPPINTFRNFVSTEGVGQWGGPAPTLVVNYHCAAGYGNGGRDCLGSDGSACSVGAECANGSCIEGICCAKGCSDVQCGSVCGRSCGKTCSGTSICQGGYCINHCTNGVQDGDETHIDCGGSCGACNCVCKDTECGLTSTCGTSCGTCPATEQCVVMSLDFQSWGVCMPHCNNGIRDADETSVDCGGSCGMCLSSCTCRGKPCGANDGCGNTCMEGSCPAATRPAAASLPVANNDTYLQAQQASLGVVNGKWVGVRGDIGGLADNGDGFGCSSNSASQDAYYHFRLSCSTTVTIDTEGSTWDTTIGLFRGDARTFTTANVIACDADSGTGNNASLQRSLAAGDYYVVVRSPTTVPGGTTYNLYIRDDEALVPTCGGGGTPGQCGVPDRCTPGVHVATQIKSFQENWTNPDSRGQESKANPPPLSYSNQPSGQQTDLFFDGFEQTLSRWAVTGLVQKNTAAVQNDGFTNRVSNNGVRLSGPASMVADVDRYGFTDLRLRYAVRTIGLDTGEQLTVAWSKDGSTWTTLATVPPTLTTWSTLSHDFTVAEPAPRSIKIRFSSNASSTTEFVDIDNVQLVSRTSNHPSVMTNASASVPWRACDAFGNALSSTDAANALNPPTATDFCPAIAGACSCPADPNSVDTSRTCTTDADCTGGKSCAKVPTGFCSVINGGSGATCPDDGNGYLLAKYCAKPFDGCGPAPALGCFGGATQRTTPMTYSQCNNPAEEPCKVVYECPAGDATGSITASRVADATSPPPNKPPVPQLSQMSTFLGLDSAVDDCHWEMRAQQASSGTFANNKQCTAGGKFGSKPIPDGIYNYSNCDDTDGVNSVSGVGNGKFDINFAPTVFKHVRVKDLPIGHADVTVEGGVNWHLRPTVWGHSFELIGVDALAKVESCGVDVHADVTLLDQDVDVTDLQKLVDGVLNDTDSFPKVTPKAEVDACRSNLGLPMTQQDFLANFTRNCTPDMPGYIACIDEDLADYSDDVIRGILTHHSPDEVQNAGFIMLANKAKKALADARRVMQYWNALRPGEAMDFAVCDVTRRAFPDRLRPDAPCDVSIVNAYITEYQNAINALTAKLPDLLPTDGFGKPKDDPKGGFDLMNDHVDYEVLAVSFAFPVGPLSALMEVSAGGYWAVGGKLDYQFNGSVIRSTTTANADIARVSASLTPEAGAWARVFVGIGAGGPIIGAHVGVEGELQLLTMSLPFTARGLLQESKTADARKPTADWADGAWDGLNPAPQVHFGNQFHHTWSATGNVGATLDIHALDGKLDLAARVKLLFYTLQFSKTIAKWAGIHKSLKGFVNPGFSVTTPDTPVQFGGFSVDVPMTILSQYLPKPGTMPAAVADPNIKSKLRGLDPGDLAWVNECALPTLPGPD